MAFFKKKQNIITQAPTGPVEFLIVGLGNPGRNYETTRHNAGFLCLDMLAQQQGFEIKKLKFKSLLADVSLFGHRSIVMKPQTYMNLSGEAVRDAAEFYKIPVENIIVIYDDINIPLGNVRIRRKGSDGGHNGIKNIIYHLHSDSFPRLKLGVGKNSEETDLKDYVLGGFSKAEAELIQNAMKSSCEALELILDGRLEQAMSKYSK